MRHVTLTLMTVALCTIGAAGAALASDSDTPELDFDARVALAEAEMREPHADAVDAFGLGGVGALGFDQFAAIQLTHVRDANFPNEETNRTRSVTSLDLEGGLGLAPLPFGGRLGIDAGAGLSFPGRGYPGIFHVHVGPHLRPSLGGIPIALTLGVGVGAGTRDVHGYVHPRVALRWHPRFDIEGGFYFVHPKASHVERGNGIEDSGIGYQRLRGSMYITIGDPYDDDMPIGLRLFVQRETFSGRDEVLFERQLRRGHYWGGGLGVVF